MSYNILSLLFLAFVAFVINSAVFCTEVAAEEGGEAAAAAAEELCANVKDGESDPELVELCTDSSPSDESPSEVPAKRKNEFVRFGKRKNEFVRFGKRKHEFVRFGKRKNEFVRFGKRKNEFVRFGRSGVPEKKYGVKF